MVQTTSHIFSGKVEVESNLRVGSSHLFVDTTNNRVGITTNDPHASLHVNGNAYVDTNLNVGTAIELNQVPGRVKATTFEGDGSLLTGVASTLSDVVNNGNVTSNTVQFTNTDTGIVTTGNVNVGNKLSVSSLSPGSVPYVNATNTLENSHITQSADTTSITSNLEVLGNVIIAGDSYAIDSQSLEVKDRIIGIAYDNILSGADTGILMEYPNRNVALVHHGASGNPYAQEFTIGYTQNTASDTTIINDTANVITVNVLGDLHTQNNMTVESGGSYFGDGTTLTGVALSSDMTSNASRISNLETSNTYLWSNLLNLSFDDVVNVNNATSNTVQFTNPTTALVTDLTSNVDIKLNQLSNVVITSPQTDQLLVYDGTDWVNEYNIHNFIKVHNTTGSTLYKGNVVYIVDSFNNNVSNVGLAKSDSSSTMPAIGLIHENISNGQEGSAVAYGKVQGIDTTGFTEGQTVYVSNTSAGNIMNTKPYGLTDQIQNVGICIKVHQTNGIVFVTGVGRSNDIPNAPIVADETDINYVYVNNTNNDFKKIEPSNLLTQLQTLEQVVNTGNTVSNVINVTGLTTTANVEVGSNISIAGLTTNKIPIVGAGNVLEDSLISKANGTIVISSDVEILGNILVDGNSYTIESNSLVINDRIIGIANNNVSHELDVGIIMQHPGKNIALIHHGEAQGDQDPHDHTFTIGYTQNTITDNHIFDDSNLITVEILGNLITQNNLTVTSGSYYGDGTTLTGVALSADLSDNASRISNLETSNDYIWSNISILENANTVQGDLITDLRTDLSGNTSRISSLEDANNVQSGLITDLTTDLSDNASRISILETANNVQGGLITDLRTDLSSNTSRISILESANNVQSGLITNLRTDVNANDGRLDLLEPRVTNLETSNEYIWSNLQSLTFDDVVNVNNATSNTVQFTNTGTSLIASGTVEAAIFKGSGAQLTNIPPSAITGTLSQWSDGANNDVYIASNVGIGNVHTLTSNTLQVGANLYVRDAGANVLTVHGNVVSTGKFLGDGTELTGVALETDLAANVLRISILESANNVQSGLITDLRTDLSSNASRISSLESANNVQGGLITDLTNDLSSNASRISSLESANNVQGGLITDLRTDLSSNTSRISSLEDANTVQAGLISDLTSNLSSNDGRITNLETDLAPIRTSTTGDIIYASATNTLNRLGIGSSGDVLSVSAGGIPEWSSGGTGGVWSTNAEGEIYFTTSNVGIANADPGHELSVGSNLYVDDDGSNVLVVSGNISADALTLGDVAIVPSYGLDAVTTESNITNQVVQFNHPTTGFVTASNAVVGGTLSIENFEIVQSYGLENVTNVNNSTEDTIISTNVTTGFQSTANISVGRDAIISGNVSIGGIMTMGTVNVVARHSLQGVTDMGNTTTHTIQFTNPTTSLMTSGNVEVAKELTVTGNVEVGTANLFVDTQNGRVGVGTTEPSGQLELVGDSTTQEYPPRALTGYSTHIEGHGVFGLHHTPGSGASGAVVNAFNKSTAVGDRWYSSVQVWTPGGQNVAGPFNYTGTHSIAGISGEWVYITLPYHVNMEYLQITAHNGDAANAPNSATIIGSSDGGTTWEQVGSWSDKTSSNFWLDGGVPSPNFTITSTKPLNAIGFVVTEANGWYAFTIGEIKFFGTPGPTTLDKGSLTLGRSLDVPRVSRYDVDTETPRPEKLVVDFDTTVNSSPTDISGQGNHGTFNGGASYSPADKAFTFGTAGDGISTSITNGQGAYVHSVSIWFKADTLANCIWHLGTDGQSAGSDTSSVFVDSNGNFGWFFWANDVSFGGIGISTGTWNHMVCVYDGGTASTSRRLWLNGIERTITSTSGSQINQALSIEANTTLRLASRRANTTVFDGQISNFKLYNVALEPSEVRKLYNLGRTGRSMVISDTAVGIGKVPEAQLDVRGVIRGTSPATFIGKGNTATNVTATATVLPVGNVIIDTVGSWDATTSRYYVKVPGIYFVSVSRVTIETTGVYVAIYIHVNGSTSTQVTFQGGSGSYPSGSLSTIVSVKAGDYIEIRASTDINYRVVGGYYDVRMIHMSM